MKEGQWSRCKNNQNPENSILKEHLESLIVEIWKEKVTTKLSNMNTTAK